MPTPYTFVMADEDTVLEEAMDNLKEAGQRIRATQSLLRSQGMTDGENYRDLLTRLSTALAMTEAAYLEARRPATDHDRAGAKKDLIRLVPHFTTRKVRCVTPAPSITRVLSSSIGSGL